MNDLMSPFLPPTPSVSPVSVLNLVPKGQCYDSPITDRYVINFVVTNPVSRTECHYEHMIDESMSMSYHCQLVERFVNAVGRTFDNQLVDDIQDGFIHDEDREWDLTSAIGPDCMTSVLSKVYVEYYDNWGKLCKVDIETIPQEDTE